ncbi:hypothetical protein ACU686_05990 [Yinghuangia aomiensis]
MPQPSTKHAKQTRRPRFRGFRRLALASVLACLSGGFVIVQEITAEHAGPPRPPVSAARPAAEPDAAQPRPLMPAQPAEQPAAQPAAQQAAQQPEQPAAALPAALPHSPPSASSFPRPAPTPPSSASVSKRPDSSPCPIRTTVASRAGTRTA